MSLQEPSNSLTDNSYYVFLHLESEYVRSMSFLIQQVHSINLQFRFHKLNRILIKNEFDIILFIHISHNDLNFTYGNTDEI